MQHSKAKLIHVFMKLLQSKQYGKVETCSREGFEDACLHHFGYQITFLCKQLKIDYAFKF